MKLLKNTLLICAALLTTNYVYTARSTTAQKQQGSTAPKKTTPSQTPKKTAARPAAQRTAKRGVRTATPVVKQQPPAEIRSYWQALNAIKIMSPTTVLKNNAFTAEFINFVKALNLSDIENKALLQAGINMHAVWTGDNAQDKLLFATLKNNLESTLQNLASMPQVQPAPIPTQQKPGAPIIQPKPGQQGAPAPAIPTTGNFPTNNAIMIFDPAKEESIERRVGAMVNCALQAMCEQAAPIIMTSNVLTIIAIALQRISLANLQRLQNVPFNQIEQFAQQLAQTSNVGQFSPTSLVLLSMANFNAHNFNCYLHKSANIALVIPKQYLATNLANAASMNAYDQAQACGFNPTELITIDNLTPDNLVQQLHNQPSAQNEEQLITKVTGLFIPQKRNGELISPEKDTKWIIYITGHGSPAHQTIGSVREQLAILKRNQQGQMGGKRRNAPAQNPQNAELIKSYEQIVAGKSDWPNSQLVPETARIAGLKGIDFVRLLKFFDTTLDVAFIHYVTCFAGGYNQTFVNEFLSSLDVDFIISAEGVDETSIISQTGFTSSSRPPYIRPQIKFTHFFNLARLFVSNPEQFVKTKEKKKEPVAQILRSVVPGMIEGNQPFVRFPGVGVFGALSLGKVTKKLTQTMVKAHEIENKTIDVTDPTINIVIVDPSRINVPLNFGRNNNCAIVSPTPATITPHYEAINVFKAVNMQTTLQQLLYDFIHLNARLHTQLFVVNTLTGIAIRESGLLQNEQSSINQLIIQMKGVPGSKTGPTDKPAMQLTPISSKDIQYSRMGVNVQITFELNNTVYQCTLGIKNFEDQDLKKYFQQITFTPATDINAIANKFLTAQEINKLVKPVTLNSIAQHIDSKINLQEPSLFNEPGTDTGALRKFFQRKPQ